MKFKRAVNFLEWMEEGQLEVPNVTLSLHGNTLFVKGDNGEFDVELPEDMIEDVTSKMQSMLDGAEGGEDEGPEGAEDEEGGGPEEMPMAAPQGEPGSLNRKPGALSGM